MRRRFRVSLDPVRAARLASLAHRAQTTETALASSLLATAIDEADPAPTEIVALLDGFDGAHERALLGLEQAKSQNTIGLEEL
jgi:hypothetical protein